LRGDSDVACIGSQINKVSTCVREGIAMTVNGRNGDQQPLVVKVDNERHALALADALAEVPGVDVHRNSSSWEVSIDGTKTDRLVVQVLDAVRSTLAGNASASAQVLLDGHEYNMQGE